jgi:hypothetical protein
MREARCRLARQDDLRYEIIKSMAVSLVCISVHVISCVRSCYGPLSFICVLGLGLSKPNSFLAIYIRRPAV